MHTCVCDGICRLIEHDWLVPSSICVGGQRPNRKPEATSGISTERFDRRNELNTRIAGSKLEVEREEIGVTGIQEPEEGVRRSWHSDD